MISLPVPSRGVSAEAAILSRSWGEPRSGELPGDTVPAARSCEETLFSALAEMKVLTSQVAMHLERSWRDRLFVQLDRLHDLEQWDEGDDPAEIGSFRTFLRMMFLLKVEKQPGLGLANGGHLLAFWIDDQNRLTIECLRRDKVKLVLTRRLGEEKESAAILTNIDRVKDVLAPYDPSCWFESA